jgi:hypothetical protein
MADRLSLAHAIEKAGINREIAEQIAVEIDDLVRENVATKPDIALLRTELKADLRELELRLDARFEAVGRQIDRVVTRLGALIVVLAGLLFAALHYWPPQG